MGYKVTIRMGESARVRWEGKGLVVYVLDEVMSIYRVLLIWTCSW
jgi:hypothetical protein